MADTQKEPDGVKKDEPPKAGFFKRVLAGPKKISHTAWEFSKELWNDHQFWVNAIAVKGGAAAILIASTVALSFAFTFPFLVTAGIILLCGATIAVGTLGILAGTNKIWDKLKDTWYKATGKQRPPAPTEKKKSLFEKIKEKPFVQKILNHRWSKKLFETRAWKTMMKIKEKQDGFLGGLAMGGSVASTVVGVWLLAVQVVALPVIAIPTLLTGAVIIGATYIASSLVGVYVASENLVHRHREKRALQKQAKSKQAGIDGVPAPEQQPASLPETPLTKSFEAANNNEGSAAPKTAEEKPESAPKAKNII